MRNHLAADWWNGQTRRYPAIVTLVIASVFLFSPVPASAEIQVDTVWNPGIPGGIPNVPVYNSVLDYGAKADGTTDDSAAFQAAIDAVPAGGGAVLVPAGEYYLRSELWLESGVVLRGEGANNTNLVFNLKSNQWTAITIGYFDEGSWISATDGYQKGSTQIKVQNASSFEAPGFAEIKQTNDAALMYTDPEWNVSWAQDAVGEIVRVIAKNGQWLTLEKPLNFTYKSAMNPKIRRQRLTQYAGIEDLRLERLDRQDAVTIWITHSAWCWIRGVESAYTYRSHVQGEWSYGLEIRDSFFHHSHAYDGGGHGYGVKFMYHTTGSLVENNVFQHLRHSMMVSVGSNGNVFAYNYSREPLSDTWWGFVPNDISVHGHWPFANLYEGNVVQHIAVGDYWGPSGPDNTFLRNCSLTEGIYIYDNSEGQEFYGNVVDNNKKINVDSSVNEITLHGNLVRGTVSWESGISDHDIPASFYLERRPAFFGSTDWPSIGSDVGSSCNNPAMERWFSGNPIPDDPPISSMIFADGVEVGDLSAWSIVTG